MQRNETNASSPNRACSKWSRKNISRFNRYPSILIWRRELPARLLPCVSRAASVIKARSKWFWAQIKAMSACAAGDCSVWQRGCSPNCASRKIKLVLIFCMAASHSAVGSIYITGQVGFATNEQAFAEGSSGGCETCLRSLCNVPKEKYDPSFTKLRFEWRRKSAGNLVLSSIHRAPSTHSCAGSGSWVFYHSLFHQN